VTPDYVALTVTALPVGPAFQLSLDRYGRVYGGLGLQGGKGALVASGSLYAGWTPGARIPKPDALRSTLDGWTIAGGAAFVIGGNVTYSPGNGFAGEYGAATPQVGVSAIRLWSLFSTPVGWGVC
jgi:hypothetical protein